MAQGYPVYLLMRNPMDSFDSAVTNKEIRQRKEQAFK